MERKKRASCVVVCAAITALLAMSCSSSPKVSRIHSSSQVDLTGRWNDSDVRLVCDSLIAQALSSPRLDKDIADFSAQHPGELPPVIVGRFSNTSSEHIDTSIITSTMRSSIINSGKLDFVEDGTAREVVRKERNDQQQGNASDVSSARLGNETAAFFMLSGTVKAIVDQADGTMVRSYFVTASLINVETNRIVWEGSNNEIKKVVKRSKAKL